MGPSIASKHGRWVAGRGRAAQRLGAELARDLPEVPEGHTRAERHQGQLQRHAF